MYTMNLSSLESPDPRYGQDDEYSQDFNTEIDYEDEILSDYADESYNEVEFSTPDEEFLDYSNEMFLYKEYSYDFADDYEYDEVSISNDQIMLENISEAKNNINKTQTYKWYTYRSILWYLNLCSIKKYVKVM